MCKLKSCPVCKTAKYLRIFDCGYSSFNPVGVKCTKCGNSWSKWEHSGFPEKEIILWYNSTRKKKRCPHCHKIID